jgi:hypothetical protein
LTHFGAAPGNNNSTTQPTFLAKGRGRRWDHALSIHNSRSVHNATSGVPALSGGKCNLLPHHREQNQSRPITRPWPGRPRTRTLDSLKFER